MTALRAPLPDDLPEDDSRMPTPLPDDKQTVPKPEEPIAMTPKRRAVFNALWRLTDYGARSWTGVIEMRGLTVGGVDAAIDGLVQLGAIRFHRQGRERCYEVLITPARIVDRAPSTHGRGRGHPLPDARYQESMASTFEHDDGRFVEALRRVHPIKQRQPAPVERAIVPPRSLWA